MKADEIGSVQFSPITGVIHSSQIVALSFRGGQIVSEPSGPGKALRVVWRNYGRMKEQGGLRWFLFAGLLRLTALLVRERIGEDNAK